MHNLMLTVSVFLTTFWELSFMCQNNSGDLVVLHFNGPAALGSLSLNYCLINSLLN